MDHSKLTLLVLCALLTMSLAPYSVTGPPNPPADATNAEAENALLVADPHTNATDDGSIARSDSSQITDEAQSFALDDPDRIIARQIFDRLAMRHTALPERELLELVDTIIRESRRNNLDPALVVAVIEVESGGYPLAVSHVGAMGLMQLLPSTGQEIAERLDIEWLGADTLFDPIINVRLGTAYLSHLTKRYGDVDTALAAYNWGPGRIDRRLRRGATVPSRYIEQVMQVFDRNAMTLVRQS